MAAISGANKINYMSRPTSPPYVLTKLKFYKYCMKGVYIARKFIKVKPFPNLFKKEMYIFDIVCQPYFGRMFINNEESI